MSDWKPKRTLAEGVSLSFATLVRPDSNCTYLFIAEAILTAPGTPHELETRLIDGRLQRVYKNLWPSLRIFWLQAAKEHADALYVVYEKQRYTYRQVFERSVKAAAVYRNVYGVRKGMWLICDLCTY